MNQLLTFNQVSTAWLEDKQDFIKPSTHACYRRIAIKRLQPVFGKKIINDITDEDIIQYLQIISEIYSHKYVTDILSVIKLIFNYVEKPFSKAKFKKYKPTKSNYGLKILSKHQQKRLEKILLSQTDLRSIGILLSLYTGMRIGEICALKWNNIDIKNHTILVSATMQRIQCENEKTKTRVIIIPPKTFASNRIIPIPKCMIDILKTINSNTDAFFLTGTDECFIEPRNMQKYIKKIYEIAYIENMTFHSLRHSFATRCLEMNFDLKSLSEILGHSSVNTTLNCYVHPTLGTKQKNMNKLNILV